MSKNAIVKYPLFVYGTLQPGHGNYEHYLSEGTIQIIEGVTIEGAVYFVSPHGGYPVAKLDEFGRIKGTIVVMDANDSGLRAAISMEEGAGYVCKQVAATLPDLSKQAVFAFHYDYEPRGPWIEDGDWAAAFDAMRL